MDKKEMDTFFKWVFGALILLAVLYFFPWKDITWGRVIMGTEGMITVSGYAESTEKNQVANFSAGVNIVNDDREKAVNEVNTKVTAITQAVKDLGVDENDIQTETISVIRNQEVVEVGGAQRVRPGQWSVNNTISITLRDVDKAGELTDVLTKNGATNVYGPSFQLDTSKKAEDSLTEAAVADARVKAEKMAKASGSRLGRVVSIVEGGQSPTIYPLMRAEAAVKMDTGVPTPVEVGSTKITKTVTVVWSLR